jgi:hypothetical protein
MSDLADHLTGPNAYFLRKKFFVKKIFEQMEPNLRFTGMFDAVPLDARTAIITKEASSKASDTKKVWPKKLTESADWPGISISSMTQDAAMLQKYGFELRIGEDYLKLSEGAGIITRAMDRVAFWMAQFREAKIAANLIAGGTALGGDWAPICQWSNPTNASYNPLEDLIKFKRKMRKVNKAFTCTDIFVNTADYEDLELWSININADIAKRELIGKTEVGDTSLYIPALKANVHRIDEGVDEGSILGIDAVHPFATYYYYNDSNYGSKEVIYNTREGQKTVPGLGLNVHQYFDDNKMEIVNKLWFDFVFAVEDPDGAINDTGI